MPRDTANRVIVIGGGPAGLMAADVLSRAGVLVDVYDRMPSLGRKFLMAGRGGLNLTHSEPLQAFLRRYREAEPWLAPSIAGFTPEDLRAFCAELGQDTFVGSSGRVFPKCLKTSPLLRAWLRRLAGRGVAFHLRHRFKGWDDSGNVLFDGPAGETIAVRADAAVLAMGGASWPRLGSNGRWVEALAGRGVAIAPLRPANCGFVTGWPAHFSERFAGAPLKSVALEFAGERKSGECIVTATGLEGSLIYAFSAALRQEIAANGAAVAWLDLKPDVAAETLANRLAAAPGKQSLANRLRKAARLPPVAIALLRLHGGPGDPAALAALIKRLPITFTAPQPLARAISTAGGVQFDALDGNLMIETLPGVFAAGEMLDWEAPTGGYLLQACFATGKAAAEGALRWLDRSAHTHA